MEIKIVKWEERYAQDFIDLSVEWLEKYVRVEPADEEILYHTLYQQQTGSCTPPVL